MLVPLSTLLARSQRAKRALLICRTSSLELVQCALESAENESQAVVLEVDMLSTQALPTLTFVDVVVHLAHHSKAHAAVIALVEPHEVAVGAVLASGISALRFAWKEQPLPRRKEFTLWAVKAGQSHKVEVIGEPGSTLTPLRLRSFADFTGVQALIIDVDVSEEGRKLVSLSYMSELAQAARVPLLLPERSMSHQERVKYIHSGVRAFLFEEELEQAYTAGVRTSLRDRSVYSPATYSRKGMQAASQAIRERIKSLNGVSNP